MAEVMLAGARNSSLSASELVAVHVWNGGEYTNVLRANSSEVATRMIKLATKICANNNFRYWKDSDMRETGYKAIKSVNWNIDQITEGPLYLDCSSFVATCVEYGTGKALGLFGTSEEVTTLVNSGYFKLVTNKGISYTNYGDLKAGDIVHRYGGHTEIVVSLNGQYNSTYYTGGAVTEYVAGENLYGNEIAAEVSWENGANGIQYGTATVTYEYVSREYSYETEFNTKTITYNALVFRSANQTEDVSNTSLLTYPTLVESPFILLKVGDYTFGTYASSTTKVTYDNKTSLAAVIKYPNYIESMTVKKVNGQVNQYTIVLVHLIEAGADPNIVDKILSTISGTRLVYITYGDYNAPSLTYKEEEALLISSSSLTDFASSRITYTLQCTSNATLLYARLFDFDKSTGVSPSTIITRMLWGSGNKYGLLDVFPGMVNRTTVEKYISKDDLPVTIEAKKSMDPVSYINYLVTCMCSYEDDPSNVLKSSTYKMSIYDTTFDDSSEINGTYFKIAKIPTESGDKSTLSSADIYEVDVGYPTDNMVMDFNVTEDQTWSLLYEYSGNITEPVYNIDASGTLVEDYLPRLAVSKSQNKMTEVQKTWWTNMTKFPISATLTLKGLVRPAMLMTYVRINALFYGLRHISSGLYFITSQTDKITKSGYKTELGLLRIAGDDEYVTTILKTRTVKIPTNVITTTSETTYTGSVTYGTGVSADNTIIRDTIYNFDYEKDITDDYIVSPENTGETIYSADPYLSNPEAQACDTEISQAFSAFAVCAALYVFMGAMTPTAIAWAASMLLNRIIDLRAMDKFPDTMYLYQYIHCNSKVLDAYNNKTGKKYSPTLSAKYFSCCSNYSNILSPASAFAYDAAYELCGTDRKVDPPYNQSFTFTDANGVSYTVPGISKEIVYQIDYVCRCGWRYTTANYASKNWTKLSYNGRTLSGATEINATLRTSNGSCDETYWSPGKTSLTSNTNVTCTYVGFPGGNTNLPAFGVDSTITKKTTSSSSSSSSGTDRVDTNARYLFEKLMAIGISFIGACGVIGNFNWESGIETRRVENLLVNAIKAAGGPDYGTTNINAYTNAIDSGKISLDEFKWPLLKYGDPKSTKYSDGHQHYGYGLAMWTDNDRKIGLYNTAKSLNASIGAIETLTIWLIKELTGSWAETVLPYLIDKNKTLSETTKAFYIGFEWNDPTLSSSGDGTFKSRLTAAKKIQEKYQAIYGN